MRKKKYGEALKANVPYFFIPDRFTIISTACSSKFSNHESAPRSEAELCGDTQVSPRPNWGVTRNIIRCIGQNLIQLYPRYLH